MLGRRESFKEFVRGENTSLREFVRGENENLREFLQRESEGMREFFLGESERMRDFFQGENESLGELVRGQVEESVRRHEEVVRHMDETREFNREILLRNEKVYTSMIAEMGETIAEMREARAQIRANTQAVLSVLDRLDGSGGAAA